MHMVGVVVGDVKHIRAIDDLQRVLLRRVGMPPTSDKARPEKPGICHNSHTSDINCDAGMGDETHLSA